MGAELNWGKKNVKRSQRVAVHVFGCSVPEKGQLQWWDRYWIKIKRDDGSRLLINKTHIVGIEKVGSADGRVLLQDAPEPVVAEAKEEVLCGQIA